MSDFVWPHRRQPTRLPRPWDSPGKNTRVGCHFLLQCIKVKSEREVAQLCPTLLTPWTAAYQAPPSMGFSRQEYWSGLPLPPPMKYEEFIKSFFLVFLICHQTYTKWKLLNSNCRSIFGANWQELLCSSLSKFLEMPLDLKPWWGPALKTI